METKYTFEMLKKALEYLECWRDQGDVVPTVEALCGYIDVSKQTIKAWEKDPGKVEIVFVLREIERIQLKTLINKGLIGDFNAKITTLMLSQHDIVERKEKTIEIGNIQDRKFEIVFIDKDGNET